MRIIKMGILPEDKTLAYLNNWKRVVKHRRCGTIIEVEIADLEAWSDYRDSSYNCHVWCPLCKQDGYNNDKAISVGFFQGLRKAHRRMLAFYGGNGVKARAKELTQQAQSKPA